MADVDKWVYSAIIKDHFMRPRGFLLGEPKEGELTLTEKWAPWLRGDIIKIWIKIEKETDRDKRFEMADLEICATA